MDFCWSKPVGGKIRRFMLVIGTITYFVEELPNYPFKFWLVKLKCSYILKIGNSPCISNPMFDAMWHHMAQSARSKLCARCRSALLSTYPYWFGLSMCPGPHIVVVRLQSMTFWRSLALCITGTMAWCSEDQMRAMKIIEKHGEVVSDVSVVLMMIMMISRCITTMDDDWKWATLRVAFSERGAEFGAAGVPQTDFRLRGWNYFFLICEHHALLLPFFAGQTPSWTEPCTTSPRLGLK